MPGPDERYEGLPSEGGDPSNKYLVERAEQEARASEAALLAELLRKEREALKADLERMDTDNG